MGAGRAKTVSADSPHKYSKYGVDNDSYIYSDEYNNLMTEITDTRALVRELTDEWSNAPDKLREDWNDLDTFMYDNFDIKPQTAYKEGLFERLNDAKDKLGKLSDERERLIKDVHRARGGRFMPEPEKATRHGYKYFTTTTTGMSGYDDYLQKSYQSTLARQGIKAYVAEMTPKEYLERSARQVFKTTYEQQVLATLSGNVPKYTKMMKQGVKFHMPVLNLRDGHEAQEGRHRAVSALLLKSTKIPVLIVEDL